MGSNFWGGAGDIIAKIGGSTGGADTANLGNWINGVNGMDKMLSGGVNDQFSDLNSLKNSNNQFSEILKAIKKGNPNVKAAQQSQQALDESKFPFRVSEIMNSFKLS